LFRHATSGKSNAIPLPLLIVSCDPDGPSIKIESMEDLFVEQVEDLYDAERRLVKALPKMAEASTSPELRQAFESHLDGT
jgi:hypothetical protein